MENFPSKFDVCPTVKDVVDFLGDIACKISFLPQETITNTSNHYTPARGAEAMLSQIMDSDMQYNQDEQLAHEMLQKPEAKEIYEQLRVDFDSAVDLKSDWTSNVEGKEN